MFEQTVTVYRKEADRIRRQVLSGCCFQYWEELTESKGLLRHFFLLALGSEQKVLPGDRILPGCGPEVSPEQWPEFIPAQVSELVQAAYAKPFPRAGELSHWEVGA